MPLVWTRLQKKWIDASNENMLSCEKDISAHNINRPMPQVEHAWCKTNELSLTYTQTILSHCFEFVPQDCLGDWDRAFERLPTYLSRRGSGQDVVQENWILKKNEIFFFLVEMRFLFLSSSSSSLFYLFIYLFIFIMNKRWSFEQPFWQIKVFKNQTNLFD